MIRKEKMVSEFDGLELELEIVLPDREPVGIVQISHGMAEHKERYEEFMEYLAQAGYVAVVHDHRGHGASVKKKEDLGYFYTNEIEGIVNDLHQVTVRIKEEYKGLSVSLFSHSMGTLVARNYMKRYDGEVEKVILCGPPTRNEAVSVAIALAKISSVLTGKKHRNHLLQKLAVDPYNNGYAGENEWICENEDTVSEYNADELCGFMFTNNGFLNLFQLQKGAYIKNGWMLQNPNLPIYLIGGKEDPVIQGEEKFKDLKSFLNEVGYTNISTKLYENNRHELLNERNRQEIFADIVGFLER